MPPNTAEQHTSPALAPPPGNPRFPLMDAIRGVALVAVLGTHSARSYADYEDAWWGRLIFDLDVALPIFFVLSGFLLYRPFVAARAAGKRVPSALTFGRRRALRILPGYWVTLTLLAAWGLIAGPFTEDWWIYYGFGQIFSAETLPMGIGPAWSLSVEVACYAVLPFYALALGLIARRSGARRAAVVDAVGLAVIAVAWVLVRAGLRSGDVDAVYPVALLGMGLYFVVGMALALASVTYHGRPRQPAPLRFVIARPGLVWLLAAAIFVVQAYALDRVELVRTPLDEWPWWIWLGNYVITGVLATLIVAPATFGDWAGGWVRRFLAIGVLGWLGVVSYGTYLWHYPFMVAMREAGWDGLIPGAPALGLWLLTMATALAAGAASYYLVELPFLRKKEPKRSAEESAARRVPAPAGAG